MAAERNLGVVAMLRRQARHSGRSRRRRETEGIVLIVRACRRAIRASGIVSLGV